MINLYMYNCSRKFHKLPARSKRVVLIEQPEHSLISIRNNLRLVTNG